MSAAMEDAHDTVVCSGVVVAVTVKPTLALASRPYDDDLMRERGRRWTIVAGHGRAGARRRIAAMAATTTRDVVSPVLV